jgi:hypothetical protein
MPSYKITAEIAAQIKAWTAEGRSSRDIASTLLNKHGVKVDRRTISTYARPTHPDPVAKVSKLPKLARIGPVATPVAQAAPSAELDEIQTLEAQAVAIKTMLEDPAGELTPRDWAALNGELRQTFNSIRKAKAAQQLAAQSESADVSWVVAKLKRFAEQNKTDAGASADLSEERDSAIGE